MARIPLSPLGTVAAKPRVRVWAAPEWAPVAKKPAGQFEEKQGIAGERRRLAMQARVIQSPNHPEACGTIVNAAASRSLRGGISLLHPDHRQPIG